MVSPARRASGTIAAAGHRRSEPKSWEVTVYRLDGSIRLLFDDDDLSGEDIIPGFR
jgi:hypothetical protein